MSAFALLEHDPNAPDAPSDAPIHWDLLIDIAGEARLPTWRLTADPRTATEVPAQRIPDHRRAYLTYEGDISGGRGRVRRIDAGPVTIHVFDRDELAAEFNGTLLRGPVKIARDHAGCLKLSRPGGSGAGGAL